MLCARGQTPARHNALSCISWIRPDYMLTVWWHRTVPTSLEYWSSVLRSLRYNITRCCCPQEASKLHGFLETLARQLEPNSEFPYGLAMVGNLKRMSGHYEVRQMTADPCVQRTTKRRLSCLFLGLTQHDKQSFSVLAGGMQHGIGVSLCSAAGVRMGCVITSNTILLCTSQAAVGDLDNTLSVVRGLERPFSLTRRGDAKRMLGDYEVWSACKACTL